jgi:hypothetical protein
MAYGPKRCACCGSTPGIEAYHLSVVYRRLPWLCHVCHGRVHGLQRQANMGLLIAAGQTWAKAAGGHGAGRYGYRHTNPELVALAKSLYREGRTFQATADELTKLGYATATGRPFVPAQVKRLIEAD